MDFRPILKPENSVVAGIATMALVGGFYVGHIGPVSDAHATAANDGNLNAAIKKTGWMSVAAVTGLTLLTRDLNVAILGGATIIGLELAYRHAIITQDGHIQQPAQGSYIPAGQPGSSANVVALAG